MVKVGQPVNANPYVAMLVPLKMAMLLPKSAVSIIAWPFLNPSSSNVNSLHTGKNSGSPVAHGNNSSIFTNNPASPLVCASMKFGRYASKLLTVDGVEGLKLVIVATMSFSLKEADRAV